ncbi:MAG TPA: glucosaminidase domain-containing protein [Chroococcales cyanobacterium]
MPVTARVQDTPHLRQRQNASKTAVASARTSSPRPAQDTAAHLRDRLELSHSAKKANLPAVSPAPRSNPKPATQSTLSASTERLKALSTAELARLGVNDKQAFFAALRPAAEEAEKLYGVPAEVTLAQAALESGWGKSALGGFNIFGIKGSGPAGTVSSKTQEWVSGRYVTITANFAKYGNFYQAVVEHGKRFHNGYYDKAVNQFAQDKDYRKFIQNIQGIYATDPKYSSKLLSIIDDYHLAA